jgi:pimeloyl-ACP methyl ester carboxylesterase
MVIAIEHMDGSAMSFQDEKGQIMHYQHPPQDGESMRVFRRTQLIKRSQELKNVLEHVYETWPNRTIYLAGHSFGGITAFYTSTLQAVKKLGVKKVLLVDPWWYALEESDLNNSSDSSYYCATTEKFHWPEQDQMAEKIINSGKNYSLRNLGQYDWKSVDCYDTRHQDLSDIAVHLPAAIKFTGNGGEKGGIAHIRHVLDFFLED